MKLINAVWEKRNLSIEACEIEIYEEDNLNDIVALLDNISAEYVVVKLPIGRVDISFKLSQYGYTYVETMNRLVHNCNLVPLTGKRKDLFDQVNFERMNNIDVEELFAFIKKGVFNTDRISLDPHFTLEQSANRYIGWIKDELEKNAHLMKMVFHNKTIGFVLLRQVSETETYQPLSCIYDEYTGKGFAVNIIYKPAYYAKSINGTPHTIFCEISSNNPNSLFSHLKYGFMLDSQKYIFVKHN